MTRKEYKKVQKMRKHKDEGWILSGVLILGMVLIATAVIFWTAGIF